MAEGFDEDRRLGAGDDQALRPMHVFILFVSALGLAVDFAEIAIGGILSALFSAPPYQVDQGALSWLLSAVYVGAVAGAFVSGWLADRYGRRTIMLAANLMIALTAAAAAVAPDIASLTVVRALSGLALGAYTPLIAAYLTDILPASRRGPLIMITAAVGTLGPPALAMLVRWLTPLEPLGIESWRWAFWICAAGGAISLFLVLFMPESPAWLASKGRYGDAARAMARFGRAAPDVTGRAPDTPEDLPVSGEPWDARSFASRIGLLLLIYFLAPWSTVGFQVLSGAVLVHKGMNVGDSLLYVAVSNFGPTVGTVLAALFIDKLQRRTALILCAVAMIFMGFAFFTVTFPSGLMASGLGFNMMSSILLALLVIYAAELFRTGERGRATSWSWASRGFGAILAPLTLLPLLNAHGPLAMFSVIAAALTMFAVTLAAFAPRGAAGRVVS